MAARPSVFQTLGKSFPLYNDMYALIGKNNPIMFKVSDQSRRWLTAMKNTIRVEALSNYSCGCDFPAVRFISDNNAAPAICQATCSSHGGWNGQWTNQPPAANGISACACIACPAP
jgi:thiamine pyridinylase